MSHQDIVISVSDDIIVYYYSDITKAVRCFVSDTWIPVIDFLASLMERKSGKIFVSKVHEDWL